MSHRQRDEKWEKEEEKEEKSWDEKWRRDALSAIVWAAIFVWAGLALLMENMGLLARFERLEGWALIFIGAGLIVLLEVVVRLLVPSHRRAVGGTLVWGFILLGIGLGNLVSWAVIWPLILIAIGVSMLLRGFVRSP